MKMKNKEEENTSSGDSTWARRARRISGRKRASGRGSSMVKSRK